MKTLMCAVVVALAAGCSNCRCDDVEERLKRLEGEYHDLDDFTNVLLNDIAHLRGYIGVTNALPSDLHYIHMRAL